MVSSIKDKTLTKDYAFRFAERLLLSVYSISPLDCAAAVNAVANRDAQKVIGMLEHLIKCEKKIIKSLKQEEKDGINGKSN